MKFFMLVAFLMTGLKVFAHGENKPGPHGGNVLMPGPFHTELLLVAEVATVWLLDMAFKNPTTENSQVTLTANNKDQSVSAECTNKKIFFECRFPQKISDYPWIKIKAVRKGVKGKEALYSLPLMFTGPASSPEDHSHHH